jgi:uncharacterized protein YdeI (YjbR/CyaY-like superfamily)
VKTLYFKDRSEWRAWLRRNSGKAKEVWLLRYKKDTGKPGIAYEDAVEEALCFGWIDSRVKRIDEARYAQRFTPRKPESMWSASNIQRVRKLIAERKITAAGLQAFRSAEQQEAPRLPARLPKELEEQFQKQSRAWENFQQFPSSYRRITARWVASAKKEETKRKRLKRLIQSSARNERIRFI